MSDTMISYPTASTEIAIIGMAGRFPGADSLEDFWRNLCAGRESLSALSDEDLQASGIGASVFNQPDYVRVAGLLKDVERFDAAFFGYTPREAAITDPQQRIFLECAWEALENAGYDPQRYDGAIGVYAGSGMNRYLLSNIYSNPAVVDSTDSFAMMIANDKDYLASRISYKLNLRGPSVVVQTACSTSLVAVHLACQALINGECDMALAGGISIKIPHGTGYLYREGGIDSPDGHCRAFDRAARGTVISSGAGVVVLARLADAVANGDRIRAVIKGSAINNDGSQKAGYTAPSAEGQAAVIRAALTLAEVDPATVSYVETHGTGTALGDPIEIAALTRAFRSFTSRSDYCALGSVKTNIGHLDAAAGAAGLIKTVLALENRMLPPSLHFTEPNPEIAFAGSPFYVNAKLTDWQAGPTLRRAGVSSFGIGGTNAHVILEEAPPLAPLAPAKPWQLMLFSARTPAALDAMQDRLARHLRDGVEAPLTDIAYTLHVGRRVFEHRRAGVFQDTLDVAAALGAPDSQGRLHSGSADWSPPELVFMFPGQGAQHVTMGLDLYTLEPVYREVVDSCAETLLAHLGFDLRNVLYPHASELASARRRIDQTIAAQPALFTVSYGLAQLWNSWGVRPTAMIGHSIGEYVAATLAGVFNLEDALRIVALRGRLMQEMPPGAMLAVQASALEIGDLLVPQLSLAAINSPRQCVLSGPAETIDELEDLLAKRGVPMRRLHVSHAYHSQLIEPAIDGFIGQMSRIELHPPRIPYISNVSGKWITPAEATDPYYWARHMRETVRFSDGIRELMREPGRIFLEAGPSRTLTGLVNQHAESGNPLLVLPSLRHSQQPGSDRVSLLASAAQLWVSGVGLDAAAMYPERRQRVILPTYPFQRRRYWVDPPERVIHQSDLAIEVEGEERQTVGPLRTSDARPPLENAYLAPRNDVERQLVDIWESVLGIRQIGVQDNFYLLNGDSLRAIQIGEQVRKRFGRSVPLKQLIQEATVEKLARLISG